MTPGSFRLMSWNLLEGCLAPFDPDIGRRPVHDERLSAARSLVRKADPDVLVINEALHCEPFGKQWQDYGGIFGFPHACYRLYDGAWGNAVLSRFPIRGEMHQLIHGPGGRQNRGFLAVHLDTPGEPTWVSTYHPHPHRRPFKREEDFEAFLSCMKGPAVMVGDLNAISPEDKPDRDHLVHGFASFQAPQDAARSVDRFIEAGRLLFDNVLPSKGWRDAVPPASRGVTIPTGLIRSDRNTDMRIDHILVNEHVVVEHARPLHEPEADIASDHYPLICELRPAAA